LFAGSCAGIFFALDVDTGEPIWSYDVTADGDAASFHGKIRFTADLVVVGNDGLEGAHLYAFEQSTGRVRWLRPTGRGTTNDVLGAGEALYVVTLEDSVFCLDRASGEPRWRFSAGKIPAEVHTLGSTPALTDTMLFVGALEGTVHALDATSGEVHWTSPLGFQVVTDVHHQAGALYVGTADGQIYRLDAKSGAILAESSVEPRTGGSFVAVADRMVVYLAPSSSEAEIAAFDLDLDLVWRVVAPQGYWSTARPFLLGDAILAGTSTGLLCAIDAESGAVDWCHEVDPEWNWSTDNVRVIGTHDSKLFVGTVGGRLYAFEFRKD
jgi:outer membrane protein assembly factor BamB